MVIGNFIEIVSGAYLEELDSCIISIYNPNGRLIVDNKDMTMYQVDTEYYYYYDFQTEETYPIGNYVIVITVERGGYYNREKFTINFESIK